MDQFLTLDMGNLGPAFNSTACMYAFWYMYIYIHINLWKPSGHRPGVPWDTRRNKQGSTGQCPADLLLLTLEKLTKKGNFARTPARCPRATRPSSGFFRIFIWTLSDATLARRHLKSLIFVQLYFRWRVHLRKENCSHSSGICSHTVTVKMLAPGFFVFIFRRCPPSRMFFQFFELSTKAAFAKAAFDTLQFT